MVPLSRSFLAAAGVLFLSSSALAAPQPKIDVCHVSGGSGNVLILNVNTNALGGHLGHGDWLPIEFFGDTDGDGFGDSTASVTGCEQPAGTVTVGGDCDDGDSASYPGASEQCDGLDNDCDGAVPAAELDADSDGYSGCEGDCDDADGTSNPGAAELCGDGLDNDCDLDVDEDCIPTCGGADLVNYWSFDGDALDLVGGNDLSVFGATSYVSGVDGDALRINWQGGGASTPDLLSQFGNGPFSLAVWVNYHGDFAGHARHEHIFFSTSNGARRDLDLFAERNGTNSFYWTQGLNTQWYTFVGASWITQQDQWHLVVLGRDTNGTQYLCEDGVVTATDPRFSNFAHSPASVFYVGRNPYENGGRSFPGAFDDMRVYDDWIGADGCAQLFQANSCQ